eukprot:gene43437-61546_t
MALVVAMAEWSLRRITQPTHPGSMVTAVTGRSATPSRAVRPPPPPPTG